MREREMEGGRDKWRDMEGEREVEVRERQGEGAERGLKQ